MGAEYIILQIKNCIFLDFLQVFHKTQTSVLTSSTWHGILQAKRLIILSRLWEGPKIRHGTDFKTISNGWRFFKQLQK